MLIIAASMEEELKGVRRELERLQPAGEAAPPPAVPWAVEVQALGVGPNRAAAAMTQLLSRRPPAARPDGVLLLGVAGALQPGMETGQLALPGRYAVEAPDAPDAAALAPDAVLRQRAEAAAAAVYLPVNDAASVTVGHLVTRAEERERLRQRHNAASVNMEDYTVAAAAQQAGVPFVAARVILDTAEQQLPEYLPELSQGNVATGVLLRPWRIPALWGLRGQLKVCQAVLTRFARAYLELDLQERRQRAALIPEPIY